MTSRPSPPLVRLEWLGEAAIRLAFEPGEPLLVNDRVHALARHLTRAALPGVRDMVPGMASLTLHLDVPRTDFLAIERSIGQGAAHLDAESRAGASETVSTHVVPVVYGGPGGPDLSDVAQATGLSEAAVISRHQALTYRVCFLGFLPGFAYLGLVADELRLPRRTTPRTRVPAGSVAVADLYTGIYPVESPGGWHVIGRTDVALFDASRAAPSLLAPGDLVRFEAVR